jgi:hypothetical protein
VENILKLFLNPAYLRKVSVVMELNCGTHYLNAIDAYNFLIKRASRLHAVLCICAYNKVNSAHVPYITHQV